MFPRNGKCVVDILERAREFPAHGILKQGLLKRGWTLTPDTDTDGAQK